MPLEPRTLGSSAPSSYEIAPKFLGLLISPMILSPVVNFFLNLLIIVVFVIILIRKFLTIDKNNDEKYFYSNKKRSLWQKNIILRFEKYGMKLKKLTPNMFLLEKSLKLF